MEDLLVLDLALSYIRSEVLSIARGIPIARNCACEASRAQMFSIDQWNDLFLLSNVSAC